MKKPIINYLSVIMVFVFLTTPLSAQQLMNPSFSPGGDVQGRNALGLCCTTQASLGNNPAVMNVFSDFRAAMGNTTFTKTTGYAKIRGSAYYDKEFKKATIYSNGEQVAQFYVRYDAFNDDLELKRNKYNLNTESLVRSESLSCKVDGMLYSYQNFIGTDGNFKKGYLVALHKSNDYTIYVRNMKLYKEGKAAKTSHGTTFPPRFLDDTEYYVSVGNSVPQGLKLKKKEVLAVFEGIEKQELNQFIKDSHIRFDTEADLVKVFRYAQDNFNEGIASRD